MNGTLLRKLRITPSAINKLDKQCWARRRSGQSDEQISTDLNIDILEVDKHYRNFEAIRLSVSSEIVDMATNIEALNGLEGVGTDLQDARQARRFTGYYDIQGNPIFERDWSVVLESVDKLSNLVQKTRSKEGGGVNIAIQNNTLNGNGSNGGNGSVRSFEQRVRDHRAALAGSTSNASRLLPSANAEVVEEEFEGEYEGEGEDDELVEAGSREAKQFRNEQSTESDNSDGSLNDIEAGDEEDEEEDDGLEDGEEK